MVSVMYTPGSQDKASDPDLYCLLRSICPNTKGIYQKASFQTTLYGHGTGLFCPLRTCNFHDYQLLIDLQMIWQNDLSITKIKEESAEWKQQYLRFQTNVIRFHTFADDFENHGSR